MVKNESLLRLTDVQSVVGGVSRATIYRWVDNGKFPAPLKPSGGVNLWKRSDIDRVDRFVGTGNPTLGRIARFAKKFGD